MENTVYLGIDIARKTFDVCLYRDSGTMPHAVFTNDAQGFDDLLAWCRKHRAAPGDLYVVMEATNTYWEELAAFLHEQNARVSVVNPRCIKDYGKSLSLRNKTDRLDARVMARYAAKERPALWQAPDANIRRLLLLLRQLEHLKMAEQKERVRLNMLRDALAQASSIRLRDFLQAEIRQMEAAVRTLIEEDAGMRRNAGLLATIPGIGEKSAAWLLAYLHDGRRFKNGKAAATYAGLTPMQMQSGESVNGRVRISKIGHSEIRKALYLPAMVYSYGRYRDGVYREFMQRLEGNGKAKKAVIVALMRKLVTVAQAVLQHQRPFEADWVQKGARRG